MLAVAAALLAWAGGALAQGGGAGRPAGDLWAVPESAIAWLAFDPGLFGAAEGADPARVLIERGLAALLVEVPPLDRGAGSAVEPVARLLELARGRPWPYRIALLELAAGPEPAPAARRAETQVRVTRLAAVIDIRVPAEAAGELAHAAGEIGPGVEARQDGGRVLIVLSRGGDGGGAILDRWIAAENVRRDQAEPWHGHRARASAAAGVPEGVARGAPVLEAWADLNALRRAMPDGFVGSRLHRLLREWRLINARSVMMHVHTVERERVRVTGAAGGEYRHAPLLAVEVSCSARSEPPDALRALAIARAEWPGDAAAHGLSPQKGAYAILMRAEWGTWLKAVLGTYRSSGTAWNEMPRSARIGAWEKKHADAAGRLIRASSGWVLAWAPGPDGPGGASSLMILAPLKADADRSQFDKDLREVSGTIDPAIRFDDKRAWWAVVFEPFGLELTWLHAGGGEERALLAGLKGPRPDEPRP